MTKEKRMDQNLYLKLLYEERLKPILKEASWSLRITEHKDKPSPVLFIRERESLFDGDGNTVVRKTLRERGILYDPSLRRCLPILREILSHVRDEDGVPLELERFLTPVRIEFRGNIPLDDEAGYKLALIFKLQERIKELDRVELLARRVARFSREEGAYWFSRITDYGSAANRWARTGLKILLAGQPHDPQVSKMLDRLRLE